MSRFTKILRGVALLTQLGLSVAAPTLLTVWLAQWLQKRFELGAWVPLAGLAVGLVSSACGLYHFYKTTLRQSERDSEKQPPSFDSHA